MYELRIRRRTMKDIARLPDNYPRLVSEHIDRLAENPRPPEARKLTGDEDYRLRVGVYRMLYGIDDANRVVTVFRVKHRREAYRR
jgi:mRNA interferase RelE/StbE